MNKKLEFNLNIPRMLETICWFANQNANKKISKHSLMKMLFFADVEHLNKYYRPILGGYYVAMKYGPVHSELYATLKNEYAPIIEANMALPFKVNQDDIISERPANLKKFSDASEECLTKSWNKYKDKSFADLTRLSHEHKAWKKVSGGFAKNPPMDYEDFFNHEVDEEILEGLYTYGSSISV